MPVAALRDTTRTEMFIVVNKDTKGIMAFGSGSRTSFLSFAAAETALSNALLIEGVANDIRKYSVKEIQL